MPKLPGIPHLQAVRAVEKAGFRIVREGRRLGRLDERRMRIEDPYGRWSRWDALPMSPDRFVTHVPD